MERKVRKKVFMVKPPPGPAYAGPDSNVPIGISPNSPFFFPVSSIEFSHRFRYNSFVNNEKEAIPCNNIRCFEI
jgi:hypothetical protein